MVQWVKVTTCRRCGDTIVKSQGLAWFSCDVHDLLTEDGTLVAVPAPASGDSWCAASPSGVERRHDPASERTHEVEVALPEDGELERPPFVECQQCGETWYDDVLLCEGCGAVLTGVSRDPLQ